MVYPRNTETLSNNTLDRHHIPSIAVSENHLLMDASYSATIQEYSSEVERVRMLFTALATRKLKKQTRNIISFMQDYEQFPAICELLKQLLTLAVDQAAVLAIKQRLAGFALEHIASFLYEQNPFLIEGRAATIAQRIED